MRIEGCGKINAWTAVVDSWTEMVGVSTFFASELLMP
jgi:hypothetical protein